MTATNTVQELENNDYLIYVRSLHRDFECSITKYRETLTPKSIAIDNFNRMVNKYGFWAWTI